MTRSTVVQAAPLLLAGLMTLTACSHEPPRGFGRGDGSASQVMSEKAVIRALGQVEASEQQRLAVLAAFDRDGSERQRSVAETDDLNRQIAKLSKREPDYLARFEPLAQRKGRLLTEQLLMQARLDQAVASTLTPEQLEQWEAQFRQAGPGGEGFGSRGGGSGRRRGGGGF